MIEFLNPGFLYVLIPAGIILFIIHFISIKSKSVVFPSIIFLKDYKKVKRLKLNLLKFILFILRSLAITLLVAGFSKPVLKGLNEDAPVIVILDTSISMNGFTNHGMTAFEAALNFIKENFKDRKVIIAGYSDRIDFIDFKVGNYEPLKKKNSFAEINMDLMKLLNEAKKISDKKPYLIFISDMHGWDLKIAESVKDFFADINVLKINVENKDGIMDVSYKRVYDGYNFIVKKLSPSQKTLYIYSAQELIKTALSNEVYIEDPPEVLRFQIEPDAYRYDDVYHVAVKKNVLSKWRYVNLGRTEYEFMDRALKTLDIAFKPYDGSSDVIVTSSIDKIKGLNFKKAVIFLKPEEFDSTSIIEGEWGVYPRGSFSGLDFEWKNIRIRKMIAVKNESGLINADNGYPVLFKKVTDGREFYFFTVELGYESSNIGLKPFFPYFVSEVARQEPKEIELENAPREESFKGKANVNVKDIEGYRAGGYSVSKYMFLASFLVLVLEVFILRVF